MTIQVMSKEKKNSKGKVKLYQGFSNFDEVFLSIFSAFVHTKFQQVMAYMAQKRTEREVVATIKAASVISTQRSYSDFIMNCKTTLPQFFGFEGVGILFRDHKTDNLFNIGDDEND